LLERGVAMVKLRVGPGWADDLATLGAVREALDPGIEMMIDGSEIFTLPTALEVASRLHDLGVRWFEEPIPQPERAGIEELARRSSVPIAYGEHLYSFDEALDALRRGQLSVLQPDATTCGGIAEARRIAQLGASFGARVVPHVCAGPIALAANLHLAASLTTIRAIEYPPSLLSAWHSLGRGAPLGIEAIVDGMLPVPAGTGLGVGLAEETAAAHPYHPPRRLAGVRDTQPSTVSAPLFPDRFAGDR
jgi:L-alanine-DL-glutamate epimerase-like enolase superfamily enzyme